MGGTLVDTYPEVDQTLAEVVWPEPTEQQLYEVAHLRSESIAHAIEVLAEQYDVSSELLDDAYTLLKKKWAHDPAPLMAGAAEVMAAATHRDRASAENLFHALGVQVDDLVCAPDGFARKPDPQMNLVLMERHGLDPSEVIAVGDRPIDIDAARTAGIEGFLLSSEPYPSTTTISSLTELLDRL